MTERPNKKALVDALDIYRDTMRPFIVRHLKRVPGHRIETCIRTALRDDQYNQFEKRIGEGRSVEDAIDVIVHGKRSITPSMSIRFGVFFGQSDEFWHGLQVECDFRRIAGERRSLVSGIQPASTLGRTYWRP